MKKRVTFDAFFLDPYEAEATYNFLEKLFPKLTFIKSPNLPTEFSSLTIHTCLHDQNPPGPCVLNRYKDNNPDEVSPTTPSDSLTPPP